jgi:hypothetical protein
MGTVWLWAAGSLIVFSHLVVLHLDGFWALVNLLNPWNIASALTLDLTVAPGLLLHMAANQLATIAPPPQNRSVMIPSTDGDRSYLGATAWTTVGDQRG